MKMKNMWNLVVGVVILGCVAMAQDEGGPRPPEGGPRPPRGERMEQRMLPPGGGFASRADDLVILMNRLKKENPDEFARLDKLRQTNHGQYMAEIRRLLPRENKAIQAMMENERNCRLLAQKVVDCENEEQKAELEKQLREAIVANFDATIEEATRRLEMLQNRIQDLKENREDILEARYQAFMQMRRRPPRPMGMKPEGTAGRPPKPPKGKDAPNGDQLPPPPPPDQLPPPPAAEK